MNDTISDYHWINSKDSCNDGFIPLFFNGEHYRLETEGGTVFVTPYKLKLLYGTNCIRRPVEDKDITDFTDNDLLDMRFSPALLRFDNQTMLITASYLFPLKSMVLSGGFAVMKTAKVKRLRYKQD